MIDFQKLKDILLRSDNVIITTHVNPDADAIGSEMAMYAVLTELGKKVHIINYSPTPYNLLFMDNDSVIEQYISDKHDHLFASCGLFIAVDMNKPERAVKMKDQIVNCIAPKICIDHHLEPEDFADYFFIDTDYSSTGHIIYDLIENTHIVPLDYNIANVLYAAIMTDTGSFRFNRTTPEVHRIAAHLLETGVDPNRVYDSIYDQSRFSKIKLLGAALSTMKMRANGAICYMILNQNDFSTTGAEESDTDGFVNFALSIEKVVIGLLFIELKDGFKVSFRSKGNIPVNKLAAEYGGGGHKNAAGSRFHNKNINDYIENILLKAEEYYYNNED